MGVVLIDNLVDLIVEATQRAASTGRIGDGKVFSLGNGGGGASSYWRIWRRCTQRDEKHEENRIYGLFCLILGLSTVAISGTASAAVSKETALFSTRSLS